MHVELSIPVLDLIIIILYMIGILVVGILSTRKLKLTSENYFLAGRGLNWDMWAQLYLLQIFQQFI